MEATNLPIFLKLGKTINSDICVIFEKIMGGHETGGWSWPKSATLR